MVAPANRWGRRDMLKQRVLTAIIAALALFVVLFALPEGLARSVIVGIILIAAWEWAGFLNFGKPPQRLIYVALVGLGIAGLLALLNAGALSVGQVLVFAIATWSMALVWLFFYPTAVPGVLRWLAGLAVLLPAWLALDIVFRMSPRLLLFMLVLVFAADVGAYFAGKRFGRVKLAPQISPGKTWEGVLGGLALVLLLSVAGAHWFNLPLNMFLPFGLAIGMVSVVGDLTVSVFKRSAGVKDSGRLFPGHGGLLDRIDSITAASPLFAYGLLWLDMS